MHLSLHTSKREYEDVLSVTSNIQSPTLICSHNIVHLKSGSLGPVHSQGKKIAEGDSSQGVHF